jgi:hypothetical protein
LKAGSGAWRWVDALLWLAVAALGLAAFSYHVLLCTFPYQLGPSEGGLLQSARALQQGWDPWSPRLAPEYCNLYGIGYPYVAAQLSRLAPAMDLLLLLRLITAASLFLALGMIYLGLRSARAPALAAAAACSAFYGAILFHDTQAARPDGLLLALYLLSVVWTLQMGWGNVLFAGAVAGSAYFVKPYGLLALPLVWALLWMQGRRRDAWLSLAAALGSGLVLTALVLWRSPLYFEGTFMVHLHAGNPSLAWMWQQWQDLFWIHWPVELALVLTWAWALWRRRSLWPTGPWRLWAGAAALAFAALLCGPGGHTGAWLSYYNQLLLPFLFMAATLWLLAQGVEARWVALALVLSGASALRFDVENCPVNSLAQTQAWARADDWVRDHPFSVYPPFFTSLAAKHHAFITDNEHSHDLVRCTWGSHTELKDAYTDRMAAISRALAQGRFQSVVCGGRWPCPDEALLKKAGYKEAEPFYLDTPFTFGTLRLAVYVHEPPVPSPGASHD